MPRVNFKRGQQHDHYGVHVGLMPLVTVTVQGNKQKYVCISFRIEWFFLEKPRVAEPYNKFPPFYGNQHFKIPG
jgi:hypothetical protein